MARWRFRIIRFKNPSGEHVWRVSGTLDGKRIRKNFRERKDAVAERQRLQVQHLNERSEGQTIWTTLTHEQNQDAIVAVNLLRRAKSKRALSFAVEYFLQHFKEAAEEVRVRTAIEKYLGEKSREHEQGIISKRQLNSIRVEMNRVTRAFGERIVGEIQATELKEHLSGSKGGDGKSPSLKTWNNRRGYLSTFFKFCLSKKYVAENPVVEIAQHKISKARGTAETLSAQQAQEFMHWIESYQGLRNKNGSFWGRPGCLAPYFALTLFAGIRPDWHTGEAAKLAAKDVRIDTGTIIVEPEVSKVNERRVIKIQPNLRLWLQKYPIGEYSIICRRFEDLWSEVRRHRDFPHDVLRHTFISMTVGAFRSVGDAALQAGNSEAVIRKHYLDLKSVEEADQFWRIVPEGTSLPEKMVKRDGRYLVETEHS